MKTAQINRIIWELNSRLDIEQIYIGYNEPVPPYTSDIIILISNKCTRTLTELEPLVARVLMDHPSYTYRLHYAHQVKEAMKKGNLYFYGVCTVDNLVYIKPNSDYEFYPEETSLEDILANAKRSFECEMEKTQAFKEGAGFYFQREHYGQAAFMLHQVIELTYRAVEFFVMGKDKRTHTIRVHQKYVKPYIPLLAELFSEDEAEQALLKRLDEAYLAVRYENTYEISESDIRRLFFKAAQAQQIAIKIYTDTCTSFQKGIEQAPSTAVFL